MDKLSHSIENLSLKFQKLKEEFQGTLKQMDELKALNKRLLKQIEEKEKIIVENSPNVIDNHVELETVNSQAELRGRIEELVKEVDGCLAILNN